MTLTNRLFLFATALWNLVVRLFYLPLSVLAWLSTLAQQWRAVLALLFVGAGFFFLAAYGPQAFVEVHFFMTCRAGPYYEREIRPVLAGVIREFFNRIVCWYNGFLWFPSGFARRVLFRILRDGGMGNMVTAFARFLGAIGQDLILDFVLTGRVFSEELDFANICARWQDFWTAWQALLCYGCNDLCPYFTKLPMIPAFFSSDQFKDDQFWCFISNTFNGLLFIGQRIIYVIREILWPTQSPRPRFEFKRGFDLLCAASTCWWRSWENAMQRVWDDFVPVKLVWEDLLCIFDALTCAWIQFFHMLLNILVNADRAYAYVRGEDFPFWNITVKEHFKEIINLLENATYFDPIVEPLPGGGEMTITHYQYLTTSQSTPLGQPNPLFGKSTAASCMCTALTRILCDPQNNGTTCAQQFAGTFLSGLDPCCFGSNFFRQITDTSAFVFEGTLHIHSFADFLLFIDRQPFSSFMKLNASRFNACIWQIFLAVQTYGGCLQKIFAELGDFLICSVELFFRLVIGLLTLPLFDAYLPGYCNYVTCPGDNALTETLKFVDRIANTTNPDGLINCLCYTINQGFNVPYAGCSGVPCMPVGFVTPSSEMTKRVRLGDSFYNLTSLTHMYAHRLTPIMTYGTGGNFGFLSRTPATTGAARAFAESYVHFDRSLERFADGMSCSRARGGFCPLKAARGAGSLEWAKSPKSTGLIPLNITNVVVNCTDPMNPTPNPPPCFNLCCFPKRFIELFAHTVAMVARMVNGGLQAKFNPNGSDYWTGAACTSGKDCFESDATTFVVRVFAPIECICELLKLFIPPQGFGDPCCAMTVAAELVSCLLQVIINIANSATGDAPNFTYIRDPKFLASDFDIVLDLAGNLFDCLCNFVQTIFNVALSDINVKNAFDPCCVFRVWFRAIVEALRGLFRAVISLATLDMEQSQCYLYVNGYGNARPNCSLSVADTGIVKQFRKITGILLAPPITPLQLHECAVSTALQRQDPNLDGLPTCLCRVVNALLAMVYQVTMGFVGSYDETPQCNINVCCVIYKLGAVYKTTIDIIAQAVATLWQNWEYKEIQVLGRNETYFIPAETVYFLFCDEYGSSPYLSDGITPNPAFYGNTMNLVNNQNYNLSQPGLPGIVNANSSSVGVALAKCGQAEPIFQAIQDLLGGCLCQNSNFNMSGPQHSTSSSGNGIANVVDDLVRWLTAYVSTNSEIFPFPIAWPRCLCYGGPNPNDPGFVRPASRFIATYLRQIVTTLRNVANPSFWTFFGGSFQDPQFADNALTDNYEDLRKTWINRFLGPIADAACSAITNAFCALSLLIGDTCIGNRYAAVSSWVRYYLEAWIRLFSLIEAFIKWFTQEAPGQCIGNPQQTSGNINEPGSQGTWGTSGELIPTCSPAGGGDYVAHRGFSMNKLGRSAVASLTFLFDALIGVARFSCDTICPGFNPLGVAPMFPGIPTEMFSGFRPAVNFLTANPVDQANACACWNDSPFTGLVTGGGSICGFQYCDLLFNSGLGTFACPGGTLSCNRTAAQMPPNTGTPAVGFEADYNNGYCSRGCTNDTSVVGTNSIIDFPIATFSWLQKWPQYPFRPVFENYQPFGFVCSPPPQVMTNAEAMADLNNNFVTDVFKAIPYPPPAPYSPYYPVPDTPTLDECYEKFYDPAQGPYEQVLIPDLLTGVFNANRGRYNTSFLPYKGSCDAWENICLANPVPPLWRSFCLHGMWNFGLYSPLTVIDTVGARSMINMCQLCRMAALNMTTFWTRETNLKQRPCSRQYCIISKGLCKNAQLVPCMQGGPLLDGAIMASLKYFICLMNNLFGNFPTEVLRWLTLAVSVLWQISGPVVRLVVGIVVVIFNFIFKPFIVALFEFIPGLIGVTVAFFNSFGQPWALGYKRDLRQMNPFEQYAQGFDAFDDAHDCIDMADAQKCFCRVLNMRPFCSISPDTGQLQPEGLTITQTLMYLRDHFAGETNCDMALHAAVDAAPAQWLDLDYARRYVITECVTQRSKGERYRLLSQDFVTPDAFYNPRAFSALMSNAMHHARRWVQDNGLFNRTKRARISDTFEKHFKISRDNYYRSINSRAKMTARFYRQELGITPESPVFEPLLQLDAMHYKWTSGYYHYLLNQASWGNFYDNTIGSQENSLEESWNELYSAARDLRDTSRLIWDHYRPEPETVERFLPPTPAFVRAAWDGSLWRGLKERLFVGFSTPSVKVNAPRWENFTLVPRALHWNARIERNLEAGHRLIHKTKHLIWPHWTSQEVHERFILGGNCLIADETVKLASEIVDYCLNEFTENIPALKRGPLGPYLERTSHLREGSFFARHRGDIEWNATGTGNWKRPKLISAARSAAEMSPRAYVPVHMYHRAVPSDTLFGQFLIWIGNLFGVNLKQTLDNWIVDFRAWIANTNTKRSDWPDVGALWWISKFTVCEFPDDVNCSQGIGLKDALWRVGLAYIVIIVVLAWVFPSFLGFVSGLVSFLIFLTVLAVVAWGYTPACWFWLFPYYGFSDEARQNLFVVPINFNILPMIPECFWDDIISVLDGIFATCWSWIPASWLNGPVCPVCDMRLALPACTDVGVATPLEALVFWGYKIFGGPWCDIWRGISSLVFLQWVPGFQGGVAQTCDILQSATQDQLDRMLPCALASIGTLAWFALGIWVLGLFLISVVPALLNVFHALLLLIPTLPWYDAVMGVGEEQGAFVMDGEEYQPEADEAEEIPVRYVPARRSMASYIAAPLRRWLMDHQKTD